MKSVTLFVVSLMVGALAALGAPPTVWAEVPPDTRTIMAGQICRALDYDDQQYIDYQVWGIENRKTNVDTPPSNGVVNVICPIVRQKTTQLGEYGVNVNVKRLKKANKPITCTLYNYDERGTLLTKTIGEFSGIGTGYIELHAESPVANEWGFYSVMCSLPGSNRATIYDIAIDEL